jgi:hypothetical protein
LPLWKVSPKVFEWLDPTYQLRSRCTGGVGLTRAYTAFHLAWKIPDISDFKHSFTYGKHGGSIRDETNLVVARSSDDSQFDQLSFDITPMGLTPYDDVVVWVHPESRQYGSIIVKADRPTGQEETKTYISRNS